MKVFQITFLPPDGTADRNYNSDHADVLLTKKNGDKLYPPVQFPQSKTQKTNSITL
jgi:hypothetical protein